MQRKLCNWKNKFCSTKYQVICSMRTNISPQHNMEFTSVFLDWLTFTLQIPDSCYEKKNTQNEHKIAHFEYFFNYHFSKTVWLAENLNEIKITHYENIFSPIKQKFSHFEKGLGNVLTKKTFFCLTEINIIFTEIHRIKTKPKKNYQNI